MFDDTDRQWVRWGEEDPWYGVLAEPEFRGGAHRDAFLRRGEAHVDAMLADCRRLGLEPAPGARSLEFGCGVGRLLAPLARRLPRAVGIDISPGMLRQAAELIPAGQAELRLADGATPLPLQPDEQFDFIFSHIVLQHIPPRRGLQLLDGLLAALAPGGTAVIQAPLATRQGLRYRLNRLRASHQILFDLSRLLTGRLQEVGRPVMQMNIYPASAVQQAAAARSCVPVWVATARDDYGYLELATWFLHRA